MKALVTGGAGFIGSHLVRALITAGAEVTVLDNLSGGSRSVVPEAANLVVADVRDADTAALVRGIKPGLVIHAAAQGSVARSMEAPDLDRDVNLAGTQHVLEGAVAAHARRFVLLSSGGAVYGHAMGARESDLPQPQSYYGVHKWAAEHYVAISGLPYGIARIANAYGSGQRADLEGGVVAIFMNRLLAGNPVEIHGDGGQRRDFVHVADVVTAIMAMAMADRSGCWNVATGTSTSVIELLSELERILARRAERRHGPPRPGDVRESRLAIDLARSELGWAPRYSLAEGLETTLHALTGT
jgi:UDP-glucose 4-epimerase